MTRPGPTGSLIGLKPGLEDAYILIHKYVFPPVLDRIAKSNIANYSIFMRHGVLFGFFDYVGTDFSKDMVAMADDPDTQAWWKLTEPLQEPLTGRKPGEWWAPMEHLSGVQNGAVTDSTVARKAFHLKRKDLDEFLFKYGDQARRLEIFARENDVYAYAEVLPGFSFHDGPEEMALVFHTGGRSAQSQKKVFVTGCFDLLHSGHVAFLKEAATYGQLHVGIGSDANVNALKGRYPVNNEEERRFMLESVRHVHHCRVNKGWGIMDFLEELDDIAPDVFVVNEDGHTPEKMELCRKMGIEYIVLKRVPHAGLPVRSTTSLRTECNIPYRIDLAGGWLDQPFVSKYYPGPVLTISIEPTLEFNDRSGMASSTRRKALELWKTDIPAGDPEMLARLLFSFDNPPGTPDVSGSQDALGIVLPGLNKLDYEGGYWPERITSVQDEGLLQWLESHIYLVTLGPRGRDYTVVENNRVSEAGAKRLSAAAKNCWSAILAKDLAGFGKHFRQSFEAQVEMFPNMAGKEILSMIELYSEKALGWKLSGAGGGGYLILISDTPVDGAFQVKIRRRSIL